MCPFNSLNTLWESETITAEISICLIKWAGLIMMRRGVMNEDRRVYRLVSAGLAGREKDGRRPGLCTEPHPGQLSEMHNNTKINPNNDVPTRQEQDGVDHGPTTAKPV